MDSPLSRQPPAACAASTTVPPAPGLIWKISTGKELGFVMVISRLVVTPG
jgi:hypothetical protein